MTVVVLAPMRLEAWAVRRGAPWLSVVRTGVGPRRARDAAARAGALAGARPATAVAIAGVAGALRPDLRPGELIVADALVSASGEVLRSCDAAAALAARLRDRGLPVHVGPIVSVERPAFGRARRALRAGGALAVDMESAWLAPVAAGRPLVVVRAVLDTPARELWNVPATLNGLRRALFSLTRAAPSLPEWAAVYGSPGMVGLTKVGS